MFRKHRRRSRDAALPEGSATTSRSSVIVIDDSTFMAQTAGRVTVVDFWAPWCGPCRAFAPIFEAAAGDYDGRVAFGKCNVDTSPRTAALLQIQSIPTLVAFGPDGSEVGRLVGAVPRRRLEAILEEVAPAAAHDAATQEGERC